MRLVYPKARWSSQILLAYVTPVSRNGLGKARITAVGSGTRASAEIREANKNSNSGIRLWIIDALSELPDLRSSRAAIEEVTICSG